MAKRFLAVCVIVSFSLICNISPSIAGNSLPRFIDSAAEVDPQSGTANTSIPIEVPAGRGGIQPNIQLQYSSGAGNGVAGVGWLLEMGSVQISTKDGLPKYDGSDSYILMQAGSTQELVYDSTLGWYRSKIEGAFMKTQKISDYWQVTDKSGTKYIFGKTANNREADPTNSAKIFKWALERVEDINGNYMTIDYIKPDGRLLANSVKYTGSTQGVGILPYAEVKFIYDPVNRTDINTNFISGFQRTLKKRLQAIEVYAASTLQRKYVLHYGALATQSKRSLLRSVTQYAADGTALPTKTFTYEENLSGNYQFTSSSIGQPILPATADFNGDGLTDLGTFSPTTHNFDVALSTGTGFSTPTTWVSDDQGYEPYLGNINNDANIDIIWHGPGNGVNYAGLSNGSTFLGVNAADYLVIFGADKSFGTADFNGDGLTDFYALSANSGRINLQMALNNGSGLYTSGSTFDVAPDDGSSIIPVDINGDNLTDIVTYKQTTGVFTLSFNSGNLTTNAFTTPVTVNNFGGQGFRPVIADFNNDGMNDIGYYQVYEKKIHYRFSDGNQINPVDFEFAASFTFDDADPYVQSGDFNGDGLVDFILNHHHLSINGSQLALSNTDGKFGDVLLSTSNGIGATTTIDYASSALYQNTSFMPFVTPVVKSVTTTNGLGDSYTTQYFYSNPSWIPEQRDFRGFGKVRITDPDGNYSETDYLQGDYTKGRVYEQRTYDSNNKLFSKTAYLWNEEQIVPGSKFVYLKRKLNYVYDGDPVLTNGKVSAEEYTYGETMQFGNPTRVIQWGEVSINSTRDSIVDAGNADTDKRRIDTTYKNISSSWVLGLPEIVYTFSGQGTLMRRTDFTYDAKGLLTSKKDWGNGDPKTTYSYDIYGNLKTTTAPIGVSTTTAGDYVTTINYDSTYQLFPTSTVNALGHTVNNQYFGVNASGVPAGCTGLWGQLFSTEDPNQQKGQRCYDTFGRTIKTISPFDTYSLPTSETQYVIGSNFVRVTSKQRVTSGQAATIDSHQFSDGLGRVIQTKAPGATPGQFTVSGITSYNSRGLPVDQYNPFFSTASLDTLFTPSTVAAGTQKTTMTYDAMGRAVQTTNPDNSYSSAIYQKWTTEVIDENGHKQTSNFDAFGRITRKFDKSGADGRDANYPNNGWSDYSNILYTYDSEGNLKKIENKKATGEVMSTVSMTYNTLGQKTSMIDADMGTWKYTYDLNGNLRTQLDARGNTITFEYDQLNRLIKKSFSDGTADVVYTYGDNMTPAPANSKGRLAQVTYDNSGNETDFEYDAVGREIESIKTINSAAKTVERSYDALNRLIDVKYPDSNHSTVHYEYNNAGQIIRVMNGGGYGTSTVYPAENMVTKTTGAAQSNGWNIWSNGYIQTPHNFATTGFYKITVRAFGYVADSVWPNMTLRLDNAVVNSATVATSSYQDFTFVVNITAGTRQIGVGFTNDAFINGQNRDLVIDTVTIAPIVSQVYVSNVTYTPSGQMDVISFGNGVTTDYDYDSRLRLSRLLTKKGSTVFQDYTYTYDSAGNIININDTTVLNHDQTFTYDALNRLVSAYGYYDNNGSAQVMKNYTYDQIGNIITKDGWTYFYNQTGSGAGKHAVSSRIKGSDTWNYTYDGNGNMLTKQLNSTPVIFYRYDVENRLIEIRKGAAWDTATKMAEYKYDGDGGRTEKKVYNGSGSLTETITFVGSLFEHSTTSTHTEIIYIYLGDMRIAAHYDGTLRYYHGDHLGSINVITKEDGTFRERTEYEPFGKQTYSDFGGYGAELAHHYFTGQYKDKESGLSFYNARYYDPDLGRFITADTINQAPDNTQTYNRYSYCGNNPVNYIDPDGHWFWLAIAIIAKVSAVVSAVTTVAGIATGNETLLKIGQISGYIAAVTGIANLGKVILDAGRQGLNGAINSGINSALSNTGGNYVQLAYNGSVQDLGRIVIRQTAMDRFVAAVGSIAGKVTSFATENAALVVGGVQIGLSAAGMIPGIGEPFDLASAGISALSGDPVGAGLGLASAIPFVGNISGVGRFGRAINFSEKQVQKKFLKHASDFGVTGNYNKVTAERFREALTVHVNSPTIREIRGTYRGVNEVNFYVDKANGLHVMTDTYGNFISGFKLNSGQLNNVLTRGKL